MVDGFGNSVNVISVLIDGFGNNVHVNFVFVDGCDTHVVLVVSCDTYDGVNFKLFQKDVSATVRIIYDAF